MPDAAALLDDLRTIRASLAANGGRRVADGRVARLERMVELFGFHVAKLDLRLHARDLETERAREAVAAAVDARRQHGPEALDTLIVSGTSSADDVHRALALSDELSVVPLFETLDDLTAAPEILERLLEDGRFAARGRRGDGRLLRLGQGRRLPRRAVGDLPARRRSSPTSRAGTTSS